MPTSNNLVPVEQKIVLFYDDELIAIRGNDGHVYVSVGQLCDALGLDRASQVRRVRNNEILVDGYRGSVNLTYPDGGTQPSGVLRVDLIPLWLTGIRLKAVKDEIQSKLKRFQREAAKVLWEAFQEGRLTSDASFDDLLKQASSDVVEAYQIAQAIMKLARNQIVLDARLDDHSRTLEEHTRRLETIEADMHQEERYISESQATQISQAIKAIAIALGKQTGRNEFGATWGEFYRKFGIAKYRYLPISRFDEAMRWLNEFYQSLTGETPF